MRISDWSSDVCSSDLGERNINEAEAVVVRRIFREFAAGKSPRAIAADLNGEGIPGPLARAWGDTSIRGHVCRGTGILNNELYAGVLVWNRLRYVKNPATGRSEEHTSELQSLMRISYAV